MRGFLDIGQSWWQCHPPERYFNKDDMGGSVTLNPSSARYPEPQQIFAELRSNDYFEGDAVVAERNSRSYLSHSATFKDNAARLVKYLNEKENKPKSCICQVYERKITRRGSPRSPRPPPPPSPPTYATTRDLNDLNHLNNVKKEALDKCTRAPTLQHPLDFVGGCPSLLAGAVMSESRQSSSARRPGIESIMSRFIKKAAAVLDTKSHPKAAPAAASRHESDLEHRTRKARNFEETEAKLPNLKLGPAPDDRPSITTNILSYLGTYNPRPQPITSNDTVWLFDNTAYRNPTTNNWEAEVIAAVFDKETGVKVSLVVADIAEKLGLGHGDEAEARIKDRLMPFMQSVLPGRVVNVDFGRRTQLKLGPGSRNGISSDIRQLPRHKDGDVVTGVAKVPRGTNGLLEMKTVYAEPEGWGIISDVDDTIKVTQTGDPIGILRSTFAADAAAVPGMPLLYRYIHTLVTKSAPWFYLSASPYNLYAFLHGFVQETYPQGTLILRDASWRNLAGLLTSLTQGTQEYKVDRMEKIHSWLPRRQMICIGDSTQSDPEAYGEMYRKHPKWIGLILIRRVENIAEVGLEEKNDASRFEKAFEGVPKSVWHVFGEAEECYKYVDKALGAKVVQA
ncbi:hypothetical protein V494_06883 [Pseudogymnoascus sp. VKM F-4513 (FW-928)]|nr:hypothetical protein V494_06883 [Pseudogymnoascus sp. VKM F-4513 (FW-928)]